MSDTASEGLSITHALGRIHLLAETLTCQLCEYCCGVSVNGWRLM